jgi:hypothetical protein
VLRLHGADPATLLARLETMAADALGAAIGS